MATQPRGGTSFVLLAGAGIAGILALVAVGLALTFLLRPAPAPQEPEVVVIATPTLLPTYTPVAVAQATPIPTPVVQPTAALPGSSPRELPDTGFGPLESAAIGLTLVLVMLFARRWRTHAG